jgi:hypothetical protein
MGQPHPTGRSCKDQPQVQGSSTNVDKDSLRNWSLMGLGGVAVSGLIQLVIFYGSTTTSGGVTERTYFPFFLAITVVATWASVIGLVIWIIWWLVGRGKHISESSARESVGPLIDQLLASGTGYDQLNAGLRAKGVANGVGSWAAELTFDYARMPRCSACGLGGVRVFAVHQVRRSAPWLFCGACGHQERADIAESAVAPAVDRHRGEEAERSSD